MASKHKGAQYLVVRTPRTTNGIIPMLINGQQQFKVTTLPLSAKKHLDRQNAKLPAHLRHVYEIMSNEIPAAPQAQQMAKRPYTRKAKQSENTAAEGQETKPSDYDLEAAFGKGIEDEID